MSSPAEHLPSRAPVKPITTILPIHRGKERLYQLQVGFSTIEVAEPSPEVFLCRYCAVRKRAASDCRHVRAVRAYRADLLLHPRLVADATRLRIVRGRLEDLLGYLQATEGDNPPVYREAIAEAARDAARLVASLGALIALAEAE